jgi:hypothetical protein
MRRALLVILVATALVVSGWSATVATTSGAPVVRTVAADLADVGTGLDRVVGEALPEAATPAPALAAVPAVRLLVGRAGALATVWLLLLTLLVALDGGASRRFRHRTGGAPPSGAPVLSVAPRRGPPTGLARTFGT